MASAQSYFERYTYVRPCVCTRACRVTMHTAAVRNTSSAVPGPDKPGTTTVPSAVKYCSKSTQQFSLVVLHTGMLPMLGHLENITGA